MTTTIRGLHEPKTVLIVPDDSAAETTAGAGGVRSSAVVRPPSSGGQPERETGGQLRIRPPSAGQAEGESRAISEAAVDASKPQCRFKEMHELWKQHRHAFRFCPWCGERLQP